MTLKEKLLHGKLLFWIGTAIAGILLGCTVAALVILNLPKKEKPVHRAPEKTIIYAPPEKTKLKPQDFLYEGDYLTCSAAPTQLGIDVSQHQGNIDWEAVKEAGVSFAIIRVGGRGYGKEGSIYNDDLSQVYYTGARAAGIQVGVYFFSQAITTQEAEEEAEFVLSQIEGWELQMPVVYDWERMEGDTRTADVDPRIVTDCMKAFCRKVEEKGHNAMVYFNPDHAESLFYIEEVTGYDFWLAYYTNWMDYPYKVDMWQYTNKGRVPGIEGDVDINLHFLETE